MIGVSGRNSALEGYTGPGTTWTNEMNLVWIMPQVQAQSFDVDLQLVQQITQWLIMCVVVKLEMFIPSMNSINAQIEEH